MTCYDKYVTEYFLPIRGCPMDYGYLPERPKDCYNISCFKDCWGREAQEKNPVEKGKEKV